jgi:CPA1 family monovalent cation:H+ antiporter
MHEGIRGVETVVLLLLLFVVIFGEIARRLKLAYPIVLVVAGLLISFIPGLPKVSLTPDIIFLAVLPPLLFHAAWQTSWRDFRYNLVSILLLAFGLIGFTVLGVALAGERLFSLLYWRTGFVLGAVVAPTDAIAATSIAKRVGLPQSIIDVLEGESLVNDATGLLALEFGVAMVVSGNTPSLGAGVLRLVYLIVAGIGVGIAVGWVAHWAELHIDDGPIEITLGVISAYAAYIAAEEAHASGVLAVVACGLYLSRKSAEFFSPGVRLQAYALWGAIDFVLNGLVFVLIGLQLPFVLTGLHSYSKALLLGYAAGFSALVIALRLLWIYPGAYLAHFIRKHFLKQPEPTPGAKQIFVTGWTGMRGVVSLAAALSIPETLKNGQPFPSRNLIIFLTFSVILVTLVLQGLTLPPLIRALGMGGASEPNREEEEARGLMLEAALAHIEESGERDLPEFAGLYTDLAEHHRERLAALEHGDANTKALLYVRQREISQELLKVQRRVLIGLRNTGRISDSVLRRLERELDLSETS